MAGTLDMELDVLGQQPMLNIYTNLSFCYPYHGSPDEVSSILNDGLSRLGESFPWLAGRVVTENAGPGKASIMKIRPRLDTPSVEIRDFREVSSVPSFEAMENAGFPIQMFDETRFCARTTFNPPAPSGPTNEVFMVVAAFVKGGLILSFSGIHSAMDMTGLEQSIYLISKACRNAPYTEEELRVGNMERKNLIELLDDGYEPGPELAHQIVKPPPPGEARPAPDPRPCDWATFLFSASSLSQLKALANTNLPPGSFVSTDDALTAFIWQAIGRARTERLGADASTMLARAVDPRRFLKLPKKYPGLVQNMTYNTAPSIKGLSEAPLSEVALSLRSKLLDTEGIAYGCRALATYVSRTSDKGLVSVAADHRVGQDLQISSWAAVEAYAMDFGIGLGPPVAVRRPMIPPVVEGLLYLLPKTPKGEIPTILCLATAEINKLTRDPEMSKLATYIGPNMNE